MAYRDEVLADAPVLYFGLDGTGTTAQTNLGTAGGTATAPTTAPTTGQTPPTNVAGAAWLFGSGTSAYLTRTGLTTGTAWTIEFWYKRSVTTSAVRRLFRVNQTTTTYFEVTINPGTGLLNVVDNSGMNNGITSATLIDNAWHHVAIVRSGNSNHEFFIDGVSQGTLIGTGTAKTSATVYIGGYTSSNSGASSYLDEVAFYNTALTNTRILAHYNVTLSAGAPVSVSNGVPAMTADAAAPAVTAAAASNSTNAVPASTASAAAPDVTATTGRVIAVPASTASAAAPDVAVTAVDAYAPQSLNITADWELNNSAGGTSSIANLVNGAAFKFGPATIPAGYRVATATVTMTRSSSNATSVGYTTRLVTSAWTEGQTGSPNVSSTTQDTGTIPIGSSLATFGIDVTNAVRNDLGNGVAVIANNGAPTVYLRETGFTDRRPTMLITLEPIPVVSVTNPVPAMTASAATPVPVVFGTTSSVIAVPAMTASVAAPAPVANLGVRLSVPAATATADMPAPTSTGVKNATVSAPVVTASATIADVVVRTANAIAVTAAEATIDLIAPSAVAVRNITIAVPDMNATIVMFQGVHADTPDIIASPPAMTAHARMPQVDQYIRVEALIEVPALTASAEEVEVIYTNQTNQNVRVLNAMTANARLMANYDPDADRYLVLVPGTVDADDKWFKMDETNGSVAVDYATGIDPGNGAITGKDDGTYVGSPTLAIDGPQSRPAVHFTGSNVLKAGNMGRQFSSFDATWEFSIKTTQMNGVIVAGGGVYQTATSGPAGGTYNGSAIRLVNGRIVLQAADFPAYTIPKVVADGEWHHVVISIPSVSQGMFEFNLSRNKPTFVMIDGQQVWSRFQFGLAASYWLPLSLMGVSGAGNVVTEGIVGDMRDFVFRSNYAVSPQTALNLYYEWSNAIVIKPEPMAATAQEVNVPYARGNMKKMVALYGLPYYLRSGTGAYTRDGKFNYYSIFAGFQIPNNGGNIASNGIDMHYLIPQTFQLEGYLVYPVAIMKQNGSNQGPFSAEGMENGENIDPWTQTYIDDETGLPRFVDLDKDLRPDITDFDALTVVNYPAPAPVDSVDGGFNEFGLSEPRQHSMGLTKTEWAVARDKLRDSILKAAYAGVNLWITEPEMAQHLGFIEGYDKHDAENFDSYRNVRARTLDELHGIGESLVAGGYSSVWQANGKRKITNLEPGLTDWEGSFISEKVKYSASDRFRLWADWTAYDVEDRPNGFQLGDEPILPMWDGGSLPMPTFIDWSVGDPRRYIVSAKPKGIVGKVISKEMDNYYGLDGVVRANPYRNNAYTIAAERGTVVRGQSIGGRAFIEFMDPEINVIKIAVDKDKDVWKGSKSNPTRSTWDYDYRRRSEIGYLVIQNISRSYARPGGVTRTVNSTVDFRYIEIGDPDLIFKPFMSMNARGLNWLKQTEELPPGEVRVFVGSMSADATMSDVSHTQDRNIVVEVEEMEAYAEARVPQNYRGDDFVERVLPARARAEMRGIGTAIQVGAAAAATAEMPDAASVTSGDTIFVYMDGDRDLTIYMKED